MPGVDDDGFVVASVGGGKEQSKDEEAPPPADEETGAADGKEAEEAAPASAAAATSPAAASSPVAATSTGNSPTAATSPAASGTQSLMATRANSTQPAGASALMVLKPAPVVTGAVVYNAKLHQQPVPEQQGKVMSFDQAKTQMQSGVRNVWKAEIELHLAEERRYGIPGTVQGTMKQNYWAFVRNNHPLISLCFAHPFHPYGRNERLAILFAVNAASLLTSAIFVIASGGEVTAANNFWLSFTVALVTIPYEHALKSCAKCKCMIAARQKSANRAARGCFRCIECCGSAVVGINMCFAVWLLIIAIILLTNVLSSGDQVTIIWISGEAQSWFYWLILQAILIRLKFKKQKEDFEKDFPGRPCIDYQYMLEGPPDVEEEPGNRSAVESVRSAASALLKKQPKAGAKSPSPQSPVSQQQQQQQVVLLVAQGGGAPVQNAQQQAPPQQQTVVMMPMQQAPQQPIHNANTVHGLSPVSQSSNTLSPGATQTVQLINLAPGASRAQRPQQTQQEQLQGFNVHQGSTHVLPAQAPQQPPASSARRKL